MYKKIILVFLFSLSLFAQVIGEVSLLRGRAFLVNDKGEQIGELKQNDSISLLDMVSVSDKSFIKFKMSDGSTLMFPGNTLMQMEKYLVKEGKRDSIINLLKGKIRAQIESYDGENEFVVKTKMSSVGVRGTEFLVNSYLVAEKPVTDAVLLSGKVKAEVVGAKAINLTPGQALNSTEYIASGKVRLISKESLTKLIINQEAFLPNIQLPNGSFIDLEKEIKNVKVEPSNTSVKDSVQKTASETAKNTGTTTTSSATTSTATTTASASTAAAKTLATPSAPSGGGGSSFISSASTGTGGVGTGSPGAVSGASTGGSGITPSSLTKAVAPKVAAKKTISYITATAWDIKDALTHRKKRKRINECHYWVYEVSSDGLTHERFRKDKDCDEFEFDLETKR